MSTSLICASHSPLMYCYARPPSCYEEIERQFALRAEAVRAFDPELVIVFGPDHFNGFFFNLMPPFCVGLRCAAAHDIGGFAGPINVPGEEAMACIRAVRRAGIDVAVSHDMTVDHGFSQTMYRVLGGLDAYPVIPIFVNGIAPPYVAFERTRLLGEAVGRFAAGLGKRVLFLGSGGMSHNPTRYYPPFGTGDPDVTGYQLHGGHGEGLSRAEWLERLEVMHHEGAHMLADGRRTRTDLKLNSKVDGQFLEMVTSSELHRIDSLDPDWLVEQAGIGSLELHAWVAAAAANLAAGGATPMIGMYSEALEYGIAFGMIHSG